MDAMPRGLVLDTDLVTDALEHAHHVLGRAGGGQLLTRGGGKVNDVEDVRNSVVAEVAGCRERRHNASNGNVGRLRDPVARLRELFEEHRVDLANVLQSFPEPVEGMKILPIRPTRQLLNEHALSAHVREKFVAKPSRAGLRDSLPRLIRSGVRLVRTPMDT